MSSQNQGTLVTWKSDKGFGFIRPDDGGKDVFVHIRDFGNISRSPQVGDIVRYQRINDGAGRTRAADVHINGLARAETPPIRKNRASRRPVRNSAEAGAEIPLPVWRLFIAAAFFGALIGLTLLTHLPVIVLPIYLVASLLAMMLYAFDKAAAMNRRWRTSEHTLLLTGLLGGWPGALIAQGMFRHKYKKQGFLVPFWISVAVNCGFLYWACTGSGATKIRDLIY